MINLNYEPELKEFISAGSIFRVLIVDHNKTIRTEIRERLKTGGLKVVEAGSGKQAIKSIAEKIPDLIILDAVMPDIHGVSVLKIIRKSYSEKQLPIIIVSSKESPEEIVQALDSGANDFVTSPIDFDVLWTRLSNQLLQKKAAEFLRSAQASLERQFKHRTEELSSTNQKLEKEIEERLLVEDKLQKQASYDELTGLPNRSLATDRLGQTLIKAKRRHLQPCVAFLDLDDFKFVNDTLGHAAGDELLREAARRLVICSRESDTVARLGGDEFLLILDDDDRQSNRSREQGIQLVAERIIESFSTPFSLDGHEVIVTPSIGFAVFPKDGKDINQLMRHADAAMYRSKNEGKNTYSFFSPEMTAKAKMRMNVETQLRHALERGEFALHYQPIVDAASGQIIKTEALLRWENKELGMISPDYFIPITEATGLIIPIGEWVVQQACKQVKTWHDSGWGEMCVTVNVSARQFQSDVCLVDVVKQALATNDLPAEALQLEITERVMLRETPKTIEVMQSLKNMGIKLLIDDFGTGYASLSYLQRYHFDAIKIDRSYISNVLVSEQDAQLVKAVIAMADSLSIPVIFEGVETKGQRDFLLEHNCKYAQGYYYSRPLPANECAALFEKSNTICSGRSLKLVIPAGSKN